MFSSKNFLYYLLVGSSLACNPGKKVATYSGEVLVRKPSVEEPVRKILEAPPGYDSIQLKYANYLRVQPEEIRNTALYHFIERWLHTPYKWGGMDERGIDCSAFLQRLFADVYLIQIPRTSIEQFFAERVEKFKSSKYLSEGDLVFFRTIEGKYVSHVGLYLQNDMFVNSSSSKGVSIASLKDPYWKKRYVASGRLKVNLQ